MANYNTFRLDKFSDPLDTPLDETPQVVLS